MNLNKFFNDKYRKVTKTPKTIEITLDKKMKKALSHRPILYEVLALAAEWTEFIVDGNKMSKNEFREIMK